LYDYQPDSRRTVERSRLFAKSVAKAERDAKQVRPPEQRDGSGIKTLMGSIPAPSYPIEQGSGNSTLPEHR